MGPGAVDGEEERGAGSAGLEGGIEEVEEELVEVAD